MCLGNTVQPFVSGPMWGLTDLDTGNLDITRSAKLAREGTEVFQLKTMMKNNNIKYSNDSM